MSDWYPEQNYCTECRKWSQVQVQHRNCGGKKWVNVITGMTYCDKCKKQWPAEISEYFCDRGHVQKMIYTDSAVVLGYGDTVIATVGNMVYVRRRSGAVVVGRRQIHTVAPVR